MPVLASSVSDNEIYLEHQIEFLFKPDSPSEIAEKIEAFGRLDEKSKKQLGVKNRKLAENYFEINRMVDSYAKLLK
jgi:glycosyltransferase involved in cell wall biosynthesis